MNAPPTPSPCGNDSAGSTPRQEKPEKPEKPEKKPRKAGPPAANKAAKPPSSDIPHAEKKTKEFVASHAAVVATISRVVVDINGKDWADGIIKSINTKRTDLNTKLEDIRLNIS
jgi:hypothetical protein